jgi:hypothetical protein
MTPARTPLLRVMLNFRRTENNAATTTSGLQWQPVISIVAGFLSILFAVYFLHMLFQFHASGSLHHILGTRRVSHPATEHETSGSWPDLSSPAGPPPYTATPLPTVTVPPRSLQDGPVRYPPNYLSPPRRHVDETMSRG